MSREPFALAQCGWGVTNDRPYRRVTTASEISGRRGHVVVTRLKRLKLVQVKYHSGNSPLGKAKVPHPVLRVRMDASDHLQFGGSHVHLSLGITIKNPIKIYKTCRTRAVVVSTSELLSNREIMSSIPD
ncbi:hypothetical protein EVAR_63269_1 [Eumeta japonica]|uniref:Uncharacterized protein n=1 Tax=Eumeta variegata TaxID=151549 RepID=A0A4C1Z0Z2_EUMVA|nr:hypothetical protein EVAR_63269_1 [Eumeta japonica]